MSDESYAPAIVEAVRRRDECRLHDILARIPGEERANQINAPDRHGITPLMWAANPIMAHKDIVGMLLDAGADPSRINPSNTNMRNPEILGMLNAAQDRIALRTVCDLHTTPSTVDVPLARRRM